VTPSSHVDWIAVQSWQAAPFCPQDVSTKPGWQAPLESQHPAQFGGHIGGGGKHWPAPLHTSPICWQSEQAAPAIPHWVGLFPPLHVFPRQHPLQLSGPQGGGAQKGSASGNFSQIKPFWAQLSHRVPLPPHAWSDVPGTHTPPEQQPLQYPPSPQIDCWQDPLKQPSPGPQSTQLTPPKPH
jgi:hypothetical protein